MVKRQTRDSYGDEEDERANKRQQLDDRSGRDILQDGATARERAAAELQLTLWIESTFARALQWNNLTQTQINAAQTQEERKQLAIDYEIRKEWYWDWSEQYTRQWAADQFLKKWQLTRQQIFQLLKADNAEPWMSINAFMGPLQEAISPSAQDSRVDMFYNHTYPWAGYLYESWWPRYGNNRDYFGTVRVDSFALRISHLIPHPANTTLRVKEQIDRGVEKFVESVREEYKESKDKANEYTYVAMAALTGLGLTYIVLQNINK